MREEEHGLQKAITQYLRLGNFCFWAVPNGRKRNIITAVKLKNEGVIAGVPDITLVFKGKYYGLEVKTEKGVLSKAQKHMHKKITDAGGECFVVTSIDDVKRILNVITEGRA